MSLQMGLHTPVFLMQGECKGNSGGALSLIGQILAEHICNTVLFANAHCQSRAVVKCPGKLPGADPVLPALNYEIRIRVLSRMLYFTSMVSVCHWELQCLFDTHHAKAVICTIGHT